MAVLTMSYEEASGNAFIGHVKWVNNVITSVFRPTLKLNCDWRHLDSPCGVTILRKLSLSGESRKIDLLHNAPFHLAAGGDL